MPHKLTCGLHLNFSRCNLAARQRSNFSISNKIWLWSGSSVYLFRCRCFCYFSILVCALSRDALIISHSHIYPPTPAHSQSLGGEAPGTPQGEAVGQALQNPSKHFQRHVCRCIVVGRGLLVACPRPASPLLMGFSESNVRHPRAPPSNASRQPAGLPRPLCGCPKPASSLHPRAPPANVSAGRSLAHKASSMGFRRQRGLSVACPKPASSLHPRAPPANVSAGRSLAHKAFSMGFRRQR